MPIEFETRLVIRGKTATFVEVPDRVMTALGPARRVPVEVVINGHRYRSTVSSRGGKFLVPLNRADREAARVTAGQTVRVAVTKDTAPRRVEVPPPLAAALEADPMAADFFRSLPYSHQKEYAAYVAEAKKEETRQRRATRTVAMLRAKRREP